MSHKKKKKNQPLSFLRQLAFVVGWFFSYFIVLLLTGDLLFAVNSIGIETDALTAQLLTSVFNPVLQYFLIRYLLRFTVSKWLLLSIIGWLIGGFLPTVNLTHELPIFNFYLEDLLMAFGFLIWTIPASVLQWLTLRRHVKSAWLWLLANAIPITMLTTAYLTAGPGHVVPLATIWLVLILQALLPAPIMIYLAKRARTAPAVTQQSNAITETDDAATRLTLTDDDTPAQDATTTTQQHRLQAESR